jgi:hypothetical protein
VHPGQAAADVLTVWVLDPAVPGIAPRSPRAVAADGTALPPGVGESDELGRRVVSVRQYVRPEAVSVTEGPVAAVDSTPARTLSLVHGLRPTLFRAPTDNDRGGHPRTRTPGPRRDWGCSSTGSRTTATVTGRG